jgi:hypothetical protein
MLYTGVNDIAGVVFTADKLSAMSLTLVIKPSMTPAINLSPETTTPA